MADNVTVTPAASKIEFASGSTTHITLSGNVSGSANAYLGTVYVHGDQNNNMGLVIQNTKTGGGNQYANIIMASEDGNIIRGQGGTTLGSMGSDLGYIQFEKTRNIRISEYSDNGYLYVASGGNIGIDTTAPARKFEVVGSTRIQGALTLKEQAAADADDADYGQLWVKTATPNELYFTNDAGTDFQLGTGIQTSSLVENNSIWIGSDPSSTTNSAEKNVGLGIEALDIITTADECTVIGYQAGDAVTTGGNNTAVGTMALSTVSTGVHNTAVGRETLRDVAAGGNYNTGIGSGVFGYGGGTQVGNTGVGTWAGYYPTGNYNTFMGYKAGYGDSSTKSAHNNVAIGSEALMSITSGDNNVAVGYQAGYSQTTGDDGDVYIGYKAGRADYGNNRNIAIGSEALISNTTGANNLAIGYKALEDNVDGVHNIAIGREAGKNLTKNQNVAIGTYAMTGAVAQYYNTAVGDGAMRGSTGGDRNTAIGYHAIGNDSTGTGGGHVTAVGFGALRKNSSSAVTYSS